MQTREEILHQALTTLAIQLSEQNIPWTRAMQHTFLTAHRGTVTLTPFPYSFKWRCRYCDEEHISCNNEGTDIICCGEVGHVNLYLELDQ